MPGRRNIEREFGVPVPGEILPPEQWTKTALKRLPEGVIDWSAIFGRSAPLVLELGCGNGRYLLGSALWRPEHDHLGLDILPVVIRYATRRANQRGLANIRFAVGEGHELLNRHVAPRSIREIHVYHPQPYYDPREVQRRLITPRFMSAVHRALEPGGELFVQTDHPGYWKYIAEIAPFFFEFAPREAPWPDSPKGRTRREIIARRRGLPIFRGHGAARASLDEQQAERLAEELPPPTFNADRRLLELDREERE